MSDLHTRIWANVRIRLRSLELDGRLTAGEVNDIASSLADKLLEDVIPRTANELATYEGWPIRLYHESGHLRFREVDADTGNLGRD